MDMTSIAVLVKENQLLLGLIFTSFVSTMPEQFPVSLSAIWAWVRMGLRTLVNMKNGVDPNSAPKLTPITDPQKDEKQLKLFP